jgi:formylglycine-generating enzyme required for sulfatase activity
VQRPVSPPAEFTSGWYAFERVTRDEQVQPLGLRPRYYDAHRSTAPALQATHRVLRGGSWTDPAEAVTVSFRMALYGLLTGRFPLAPAANVGFRLARFERHR